MNVKDFEAFVMREITAKLIAYTPFIKNTVEREEWKIFRQVMLPGSLTDIPSIPTRRTVAQLEPITGIYRLIIKAMQSSI
jgi:hypothetical protein